MASSWAPRAMTDTCAPACANLTASIPPIAPAPMMHIFIFVGLFETLNQPKPNIVNFSFYFFIQNSLEILSISRQ